MGLFFRMFAALKTGAKADLQRKCKVICICNSSDSVCKPFLSVCLHQYADRVLMIKPCEFMGGEHTNVNIYHMQGDFPKWKLKSGSSFCSFFFRTSWGKLQIDTQKYPQSFLPIRRVGRRYKKMERDSVHISTSVNVLSDKTVAE